MATKMETVISVLVIIAILISAGTLFYATTVMSQLAATTESVAKLADSVVEVTGSVAELTRSVADLTRSMEEIAGEVGASVEGIAAARALAKRLCI